MTERRRPPRMVAAALSVSLAALGAPASAEPSKASLSGTIVSATDHAPLGGVKVHAGDPKSGVIFSSRPTSEDGSFSVEGLPASGYELAVEADGGLYLVPTPVRLAPGAAQHLTVAVNRDGGEDDDDEDSDGVPGEGRIRGVRIWDGPFTAAGLVLGLAFVVGALVENATDDPDVIMSDPAPGG